MSGEEQKHQEDVGPEVGELLTPAAAEVWREAGRVALSRGTSGTANTPPSVTIGARHVAYVLFCQNPLGPRLAWATCTTDVPGLRRDVEHWASLPATEAWSSFGLLDEAAPLLQAALAARRRRDTAEAATGVAAREGGSAVGGPGAAADVGDLLLALFDEGLRLGPLLARSGLRLADAEAQLPRALRATEIYRSQAAQSEALPPPLAVGLSVRPPGLGKAMRTATAWMQELQGDRSEEELRRPPVVPPRAQPAARPAAQPAALAAAVPPLQAVASGTGATRPWAPGEVEAEMAEFAPRSAQRAAIRRPVLATCGVELVERARAGRLDPVVGRDDEISRVLQVLARRTKNNVALVGAPGVGKTAVAEGIAQRIAEGRVPPQLRRCQELWALDIGALLAGTGLRGDFEERLRDLLQEVRASEGEVMLFIDELHLVLGAGRSENNNVDAANLMKPMLARGELRCIGATTSEEYRRLILAKDAAFERRFQVVELAEPGLEAAAAMLCGLLPLYARHHGLIVPAALAEVAVAASVRCIRGRSLPDKAIDVLDEACCFAADVGADEVTTEHIFAVAERWHMPAAAPRPWIPWLSRWPSRWLPSLRRSRL